MIWTLDLAVALPCGYLTEIHVNRNGEEVGIFDPAGLRLALQTGQVLPTDLAWVQGKTNWMPVSELPKEVLAIPDPPPLSAESTGPRTYYCVPVWRFAICSLLTGGLYEMWWMLQNWHYIRQRDQSNIWPFFRMLFAPIWIFFLASDIERNTRGGTNRVPILTGLYLLTTFSAPLPEPWWVLTYFTFVPLLPLVRQIEGHNAKLVGAPLPRQLFYTRHFVICGLFLPLIVARTMIGFQVTTGPRILEGNDLRERNIAFFQRERLIGESEAVLFAYSGPIYPLRSRGLILTDKRLVRYERGDEGLNIKSTDLEDLRRMNVHRPGIFNVQAIIELATEKENFEIVIGTDNDRDLKFIRTLENSLPKEEPKDQLQQPDSKDADAGSSSTDQ